jgi:hypothetical protein
MKGRKLYIYVCKQEQQENITTYIAKLQLTIVSFIAKCSTDTETLLINGDDKRQEPILVYYQLQMSSMTV